MHEENININLSKHWTPIIQWQRIKSWNKDFNHISILVGYAMASVKSNSPGKMAQEEL
jgi:hypothetical protein